MKDIDYGSGVTCCLNSTGGRQQIWNLVLHDKVIGWYVRDLDDFSLSPTVVFRPTEFGAQMGFSEHPTDDPLMSVRAQHREIIRLLKAQSTP